ncbi:hypothetical protein JCM11641_003236 [Rhodosporidiobolus odoratus]
MYLRCSSRLYLVAAEPVIHPFLLFSLSVFRSTFPAFHPSTATCNAMIQHSAVEGWIVLVTNVHEEASEDDLMDRFADYGDVKNLHLNLDRRSGYVKGYALVEYETKDEAEKAISEAPKEPFLEKTLACDFAFVRAPIGAKPTAVATESRGSRGRSASPSRKPLVTRID